MPIICKELPTTTKRSWEEGQTLRTKNLCRKTTGEAWDVNDRFHDVVEPEVHSAQNEECAIHLANHMQTNAPKGTGERAKNSEGRIHVERLRKIRV